MVTIFVCPEPAVIARWSETLDVVHQRIAHRFARVEVRERVRRYLAGLLDGTEQAEEVAPGALAYFRPDEATRDPPLQCVQGLRPSRDGVRFDTCLLRDHPALLSCRRAE